MKSIHLICKAIFEPVVVGQLVLMFLLWWLVSCSNGESALKVGEISRKVEISWSPNTESDILGYYIMLKRASEPAWAVSPFIFHPDTMYTFNNLWDYPMQEIFFTVIARDKENLESIPSDTVSVFTDTTVVVSRPPAKVRGIKVRTITEVGVQ